MTMTKELSEKFKIISFILIFIVVVAHTKNLLIIDDNFRLIASSIDTVIPVLFYEGMPRAALALFFMMSGYLFFLNIDKFNSFYLFYKYKLWSRFKSLIIPYLFWSIFWLLIILILQNLHFAQKFIGRPISISNYSEILSRITINPIPDHLWFLRELFMLVLISPIIYLFLSYIKQRYINLSILILLFIDWLLFDYYPHIFRNETLFFFFLGSYFGLHGLPDKFTITPSKRTICLVTILWVFILIIAIILKISFNEYNIVVYRLSIPLGVYEFWYLYDLIPKGKLRLLLPISGFTFFIYLAHYPMMLIFMKGLLYYQLPLFLVYLISPILTIYLVVKTGRLMKVHWPKLYNIMAGSR